MDRTLKAVYIWIVLALVWMGLELLLYGEIQPRSHKVALEIHDMRFHACKDSDNYPDKVELKMVDGKMVWYHR